MGDLEMIDASALAIESLDQRVRRRMPSRAEEILATLRENSITMLEIQHGITPSDLMNELGLSEDEANAVVLEEASWKQKTDTPDHSWLDSVLDSLPGHFDEGMKQKVRFAISNAGVRNVDELRGMTPEDLAKAKVPLAARGWLSAHYNRRVAAPSASAAPDPPSEFRVLPTTGGMNPKLVLNTRTGKPMSRVRLPSLLTSVYAVQASPTPLCLSRWWGWVSRIQMRRRPSSAPTTVRCRLPTSAHPVVSAHCLLSRESVLRQAAIDYLVSRPASAAAAAPAAVAAAATAPSPAAPLVRQPVAAPTGEGGRFALPLPPPPFAPSSLLTPSRIISLPLACPPTSALPLCPCP